MDPKDSSDFPQDTDDDGTPDGDANNTQSWMDIDDDGDGVLDNVDADPLDPTIGEIIDEPPNDGGNIYLWLIILLVIVGVVGALIILRRKPPKTEYSVEGEEALVTQNTK